MAVNNLPNGGNMKKKFDEIKDIVLEMGIMITSQNREEELIIVNDEESGIKNMIIDCEDPILIIEQLIMKTPASSDLLFKRLLQMNRELIHGAFVLDESGENILFRDTLQIDNLDRNELEASIQSLQFALSEYASELITFSAR